MKSVNNNFIFGRCSPVINGKAIWITICGRMNYQLRQNEPERKLWWPVHNVIDGRIKDIIVSTILNNI
jgi:hypothetical protein